MDEEYNWDDFDAQSAEYLNSDAYTGGGFDTPDGMQWGGGAEMSQDYSNFFPAQETPQFDFNSSIPQGTWNMGQGDNVGIPADVQYAPEGSNGGWDLGSIQSTLSNLFNGQGSKGMLTGLGAVLEGAQNKKKASNIQRIVQQQQTRLDPFASQRPQYQQELSRTVQDPYSSPMVKNQIEQIRRAQAIKDAAAGRRSNSATSDPAMLAAQAQVAQQYMNSLMTPAGANINPSGGGGLEALLQGVNSNVNGYASPIMSALGYNNQATQNTAQLDALKKFLAGGQ